MGPCMSAPSAAPGPYAMNSPDSLAAVKSNSRLVQLRGGSHTLAE